MRLKNYKDDLNKRLYDPEYAAEYLAQVLAENDSAAFLITLKDTVEAGEGMGSLASRLTRGRRAGPPRSGESPAWQIVCCRLDYFHPSPAGPCSRR